MRLLWACAAVACAALSCSPPGNVYSEYRTVDAEGWRYGDTLVFNPQFADSLVSGQLVGAVSHDGDFRYSSLWLEVTTLTPAGAPVKDTLEFRLADDFGRWRGNGFGAHMQMTDTIGHTVTLASGSPVKVRHIMRTDTLTSLQRVGIFFLPAQ